MENTLIIKTGAAGDVVRTTSLLNILHGNIYWVIAEESKLLLPDNMPGLTVFPISEAFQLLKGKDFVQVISLEEDMECAKLASEVKSKQLSGIYLDKGKINYTADSAHWFDMSRVSRFGIEKANQLKAANKLTYQDCIFKIIGKSFNGEPYRIFTPSVKQKHKLIGIEKRSGKQWPDKQWWGYDELIAMLKKEDHSVKIFAQRNNIRDYLQDIAECSHVVSGDTLTMHIAMAYKISCTAIFNCTSPQEIYDYGVLKKVVSPLLDKYFYVPSFDKEVIESVPLAEVYNTLPL
jgi:heptosyltransferase-2